MLPAFTRSQNKTQLLPIPVIELQVYIDIISLKNQKYLTFRRAGLEPTSSGHEPGMFPFTLPPKIVFDL